MKGIRFALGMFFAYLTMELLGPVIFGMIKKLDEYDEEEYL